jgi:hypothetical protein
MSILAVCKDAGMTVSLTAALSGVTSSAIVEKAIPAATREMIVMLDLMA